MFANKILNTMSSGGRRLGLIYVSSDVDSGTAIDFELFGFLPNPNGDGIFKYFPEGDVYLSLHTGTQLYKDGYTINNNWFPLILVEKDITIKLNNKILNTSNLITFNDGRFKAEYVTCTLRGWDSSTMTKQYYVVSVYVADLPQTENYYDVSGIVDENYEFNFLIGNDKGKFYIDKENNIEISKPVKLYYTDIDYGNFKMEQNSPYLAGSLGTINVNGVNKQSLKINITNSGVLDDPDYWQLKYELEANNFVFNNKYEVNQMKFPYRCKEVFFGLASIGGSGFSLLRKDEHGIIFDGADFHTLSRYTDVGGSFTGRVDYPSSVTYYNPMPFYSLSSSNFTINIALTHVQTDGISSVSAPIYYENQEWEDNDYIISGLHLEATDGSS